MRLKSSPPPENLYRILAEMRIGRTDLDLFYRFMKAAESKKSASKIRRVYELAKLLVLSSTDDHFVSVFRTASEMADIMKYLRDGVEFGMWDDA